MQFLPHTKSPSPGTPCESTTPSTISPTQPLAHQVGGHAGVQTTADGSLLIKPAYPLELEFYQSVMAMPALVPLHPWIPRFLGTLRLEGQRTDDGEVVQGVPSGLEEQKDCLVLENLTYPFLRPNILDVKLGTVLFDEDATPEKRTRMEERARSTTSLETGIRITGFQVFDNTTAKAVTTPKSYGRAITPADLPAGIARVFPVAFDGSGIFGLPAHILVPILDALTDAVRAIRKAVAAVEIRMIGGSLLIVYEAEWDRAAEGIEWLEAHPGQFVEEEDEDEDEDENEDEEQEEGDDDEMSTPRKAGPPFVVKLIDFAHTRLKPGEGPDEGVLKGLDKVIELLDGRREEVRAALQPRPHTPQ
ncbi:SAICAR synthase-like protein [Dentipellis sp. KUC8613]|nr:SAICAR synthase-like protein [Dentipellis sp. KUC8613]